jgi:DNA polymerase III delta prime subunit
MHAYLVVGEGEELEKKVAEMVRELKVKVLEYPAKKIEDIRLLNSFVSLTLTTPTAILLRGVDEATDEALNAFLKNLEEPQENLYYILTAASPHKVLPTIVSRCLIVRVSGAKRVGPGEAKDFLNKEVGEKIADLEKIRDREEAIAFVSDFVRGLHQLIKKGENYQKVAGAARVSQTTIERLKANGNVTLQLTNLAISLV